MSEPKPSQGNSDHLVVRLSLLSPRPITIIGRRRRQLIGEGGGRKGREGGRSREGRGSSPFLPFLPATAKSSEEEGKRETDPILFPVQASRICFHETLFVYATRLICTSVSQLDKAFRMIPCIGFLIGSSYFGSHGTVQGQRRRCRESGDLAGDKKDKADLSCCCPHPIADGASD